MTRRGLGQREDFSARLWKGDAGLFSQNEAEREKILPRLGWLTAPRETLDIAAGIEDFARRAYADGFRHAVLLGMGGSSLAPLVLSRIFPRHPRSLELDVLDTTSPDAVAFLLSGLKAKTTLVVVASKSGTTIEPLALASVFEDWLGRGGCRPEKHMAAITDPGTPLARRAEKDGFRKVFLAPMRVGGRYSALTVFGMLPAALMGIDIRGLLCRGLAMAERCKAEVPADNPGVSLGVWLADAAAAGRDKLTIITSPTLTPMALWLEQLIAESSGKEGQGLIPAAGEDIADVEEYGTDRALVHLSLAGEKTPNWDPDEYRRLDIPYREISLESLEALGGEFFRWETASAALCSFIGVNPFDEPNVTESKNATATLLGEYEDSAAFTIKERKVSSPFGTLYPPDKWAGDALGMARRFCGDIPTGGYLAVLAYLPPEEATESLCRCLGAWSRRRTHAATTFGWGPRYLHSTGQIHKGGPPSGRFLFLTHDTAAEVPVPGRPWGLGNLMLAQALGDERALRKRNLPVMRLHLGSDPENLRRFVAALTEC